MTYAIANYDGPSAQPTVYSGVCFRSKLEAKTAQSLDNFSISWVYEPHQFKLDNGLWYRPDFWLPYMQTYIECKGTKTPEAMAKAHGLVSCMGDPVLVLGYDWVKLFTKNANQFVTEKKDVHCFNGPVFLVKCNYCRKYWFVSNETTYICPSCETHNTAFSEAYKIDGANDLFNHGQERVSKEYAIYCD